MARLHGRNGRMYADFSSAGGGSASPVASMESWEMNFTAERVEVTSLGDTSRQYVQGLPNAEGSFSGFYDEGENTPYSAATDITTTGARKFYAYANLGDTTKYWYGSAFFDCTVGTSVSGAVTLSGSWAAASDITAVGIT